ncbi:RING-H2 finger protein ATL11 [Citrus sinensis]|uniref:RING-H2 finger protein ATL11 n=1 Tax=Citrus sinensis TaxID=2711 RepID=A0ACB8KPZ7_CITSI|nr:RING-H2 finger protein ATL11 [Citrus sinensis]
MTVLTPNPSRSIFNPMICDHGVVNFLFLFLYLHALPYVTAQTPPPPPDPFSVTGPKFNGTMAIVTVILVSVFFILGFFSVYIRQCTDRRLGRNSPDAFATIIGGINQRSRRGARGLDDSVINTFPTFLYSAVRELKIGKGSLECAVCLNEFGDEETLRLIPKCSHVFHMDCIDAWLSAHNTCPVCRANLVPQPGETPSTFIPVLNPDVGSSRLEQGSDNIQEISSTDVQRRDEEAPDVILTNQNRPPRSRSIGWRRPSGWFPRSHSTGHSVVQPGQDCERFTLRLPAEVRSQLMNSSLSRSKSCVAFPSVRSSRRGFRSGSGGFVLGRNHNHHLYERFGPPSRSGHWGLGLAPPFISRSGSVRTPRTTGDGVEVSCLPSKNLFSSAKSSSFEDDREGERSSDRLRPDNQV